MAACCQDERDVEWLQRDVAQCVSVCVMWCVSVSRVACRRVTCHVSTCRRVVRTSVMSSGSSEMSLSVCQCVACRRVGVSRVVSRRAGVLSGRA